MTSFHSPRCRRAASKKFKWIASERDTIVLWRAHGVGWSALWQIEKFTLSPLKTRHLKTQSSPASSACQEQEEEWVGAWVKSTMSLYFIKSVCSRWICEPPLHLFLTPHPAKAQRLSAYYCPGTTTLRVVVVAGVLRTRVNIFSFNDWNFKEHHYNVAGIKSTPVPTLG